MRARTHSRTHFGTKRTPNRGHTVLYCNLPKCINHCIGIVCESHCTNAASGYFCFSPFFYSSYSTILFAISKQCVVGYAVEKNICWCCRRRRRQCTIKSGLSLFHALPYAMNVRHMSRAHKFKNTQTEHNSSSRFS